MGDAMRLFTRRFGFEGWFWGGDEMSGLSPQQSCGLALAYVNIPAS